MGPSFGWFKLVTLLPIVLISKGHETCKDLRQTIHHQVHTPYYNLTCSLSMAGAKSRAINTAIANAANQDILTVVAAGNVAEPACNFSPASAREAITVGAIGMNDMMSDFSNYGSCIDLFAPGEGILSAYINSRYGTAWMSGTSMAAPQVSGIAALHLARMPHLSVQNLTRIILSQSTKDQIYQLPKGNPNRILFYTP